MHRKRSTAESSPVRAIRVLDTLASARRPLTNLEIAEQLGVGPSSALALMRDLSDGGFVIRDSRTKRFWLHPRVADVGARIHCATALSPAMERMVQRLAKATGESICLSVQFETRVEVARLTLGPDGERPALFEGMTGPMLSSGAGVCILSLMNQTVREQTIRHCRRYGDSFGPGRRNLGDLVAAIRSVEERGYIVQSIGAAGGVAGIAFPLSVGTPLHQFGALIVGGNASRIHSRERDIVTVVQRVLGRRDKALRSRGNSTG